MRAPWDKMSNETLEGIALRVRGDVAVCGFWSEQRRRRPYALVADEAGITSNNLRDIIRRAVTELTSTG